LFIYSEHDTAGICLYFSDLGFMEHGTAAFYIVIQGLSDIFKINLKIKTMSLKYEAPHSSLTSLESQYKMQLFHAP
jgi:hypothetical protein